MNAAEERFICFSIRFCLFPVDKNQVKTNSCSPSVFRLCKVHSWEPVIFNPNTDSFLDAPVVGLQQDPDPKSTIPPALQKRRSGGVAFRVS